MRIFISLAIIFCLFSTLRAQNCEVPNTDFQKWDSVRVATLVMPGDSNDFFWPRGWQPFLWDGIEDNMEPFVRTEGGIADSALALPADGLSFISPSVATYHYCDILAPSLKLDVYHEGGADDSLIIGAFVYEVDTTGFDNIDSVIAAVVQNTVPNNVLAVIDTSLVGGAQEFIRHELPFRILQSNGNPALVLTTISYVRGGDNIGSKYLYAIDNVSILSNTTDIEDDISQLENMNLYPNPAYESVNLEVDFSRPYRVELVNLNGQTVLQTGLLHGNQSLKLKNVSAGLYLTVLRNEAGEVMSRKKLIVE